MSDEPNLLNGNGERDAPTAEDRRLEALLASLPRRRCPERVRRNVLAALQSELEASAGGAAATAPRPAKVIPFYRRRIARFLEAAALVAVAAIGYTVYRETSGRFRFEPAKEAARKAEKPPVRALKEADADSVRIGTALPTDVAGGMAEAERLEKKVEEVQAFRSIPDKGAAEKDETAKPGPPVAVPPDGAKAIEMAETQGKHFAARPAATAMPFSSEPMPTPAAPPSPAAAPVAAAPPAVAAASAPPLDQAVQTAPEAQAFAFGMKEDTGAVAFKAGEGGRKSKARATKSVPAAEPQVAAAARAIESKDVSAPVQWFDWYEIETSAPAREKFLARNTIQEIRWDVAREVAAPSRADDAWNRFSESAVTSFAQFIETWGGRITDSQAVVVTPGNRRAILVECTVPGAHSGALQNAVHQKRLVAVASAPPPQIQGVLRWTPARAQEAMDRQADVQTTIAMRTVQTPPPIQRLNEQDLAANRVSPFTNFFVQSPPPNQQAAIANTQMARNVQSRSAVNGPVQEGAQRRSFTAQARQVTPFSDQMAQPARGRTAAQQEAPAMELGQAQIADGQERRLAGAAVGRVAAQPSTAGAQQAGAGQAGGDFAYGRYPSDAAAEMVRLYFILEPDQLPVQVAPAQSPENR
ncbi:MAG: hypothetical protein N3D11_14390 [Candidatus Sumerlaeia bacterium]|nr:hypothetical protein [Candidatus Sumerlaeia bacterium]